MKSMLRLTAGILLAAGSNLSAATLYVSLASPNPTPPYGSWDTAATNIQDAVNAAHAGDLVLVTNGLYAGGITVSNPVMVLSVNGPQVTSIDGRGASRCVWMLNGAALCGFTLTNGWAGTDGGGVWCSATNVSITNCLIMGSSAAGQGGGVSGGTLTGCTLSGNSAASGGGAAVATLNYCILSGNSSVTNGVGVTYGGGGVFQCTLNSCLLTGNSAGVGGGAYGGRLNNCTLAGNEADIFGGGALFANLYNSIIYFNNAPSGTNTYECFLDHCDTTPLAGLFSIDLDPQFVDRAGGNLRLQPTSPCINAGTNAYVHGTTDLDGNPRISGGTVDLGAYEIQYSGAPLITQQPFSQPGLVGTNVTFTVGVEGSLPLSFQWRFNGDAVSGATGSTLTLTAVQTNQAGGYSVVVTNSFGSVTSQVAVLTVIGVPPSITLQPLSQTGYAGTDVSFTAGADGVPLSFQWLFNGAAIPGATTTNLTLRVVTTNQAGAYSMLVTNPLGSATSQVAVLMVLDVAPSITNQPLSQSASAGSDVSFTAGAVGSLPLFWQWRFNGAPISNATNSTLSLQAVTTDQAGAYSVIVSNALGTVTSTDAALTIVPRAVSFVWQNSPNPAAPYTSWTTAAHSIQDAVNAAGSGDQIVVTNGVYPGGVTLSKPLTVMSINGPLFTVIDGVYVNTCVSLTPGASVTGFTLTNGFAPSGTGGGVWCPTTNAFVTNCLITTCRAGWIGGGAAGATLYNCTLTANWATNTSGGVFGSTLINCRITNNIVGGVNSCTLFNCTLNGNTQSGGGAVNSTLYNCTLTGNAYGVMGCTLYNCLVYYNPAPGGANYDSASTLNFCCTTPMPKSGLGNITNEPALAGDWRLSVASPCRGAGSPAYASGVDLDGEPWLNPPSIGCDEFYSGSCTGALSLSVTASLTNIATGFDINLDGVIGGNASASRWDFGDGTVESNRLHTTHQWLGAGDYDVALRAYNNDYPDGIAATITIHVSAAPVHYVNLNSASPSAPYTSWETAARSIQEAVDAATLPGALVMVTNGTYSLGGSNAARVWADKPITIQSVNGPTATIIEGSLSPAVRGVYLGNRAVLSGFTITNGASQYGGGGGVYCVSTSGVVTNCAVAGNSGGGVYSGTVYHCSLTGNSGGGASSSVLNDCTVAGNSDGGAYGGTLNYCLLVSNRVSQAGGGALWATLNNCTLIGNSAPNGGGGAYGGTLNNCLLFANSCSGGGGGAQSATLNNCTVTRNTAGPDYSFAGGVQGCTLNNCIVYDNTAPNHYGSILNYCCTTPMPNEGAGNMTNAPLFIDSANDDFRLQAGSPCINAGNNAFVVGTTDLDGNPRISGGTVDIGAYESSDSGSVISYAWLQQYGLPTDGSADFVDTDGDGMNNWQEWVCGTDPTNALSVFRLLSAESNGSNVTVTWQSVAGISYFLERASDLSSITQGSTNSAWADDSIVLATNIAGQPDTTSYTDTNAADGGPFFYRVGVKAP